MAKIYSALISNANPVLTKRLNLLFSKALDLSFVLLNDAQAQIGTVKFDQKISDTQGGFTGGLNNYMRFGCSVTSIGDLDGNGLTDLVVGTPYNDHGGSYQGVVWFNAGSLSVELTYFNTNVVVLDLCN